MKKRLLGVTALCMIGLLAGLALAQEGGREERRKRAAGRERVAQRGDRGARADRGQEMYEKLIEELKLTEKQEAPVQQILTTYRQALASWTQQNGPAMRELSMKLRGGRGQEGGEAAKTVSEDEKKEIIGKIQELQKKRTAITENLFKQLKDHLTEEQMATARRILGRGDRPGGAAMSLAMLRRLDLTAEQQEKVKGIMAAVREGAKDRDARGTGEAYREAMQKIVKEVLTDEQRTKLETLRTETPRRGAVGMFAGLDLTEEQQKQIREIQRSIREKVTAAEGREAKREVYTKMQKEMEAVLTPEQREKLDQRRKEMREKLKRDRGERPREGRRAKDQPVVVE